MRRLVSLMIVVGVSGCSGLSNEVELAQQNEWELLGYQDGEKGRLARSQDALSQLHPLTQDAQKQYRLGYQYGIEDYCTPYKTFDHGKAGITYRGQCKNTQNEKLAIQGWEAGYEAYMENPNALWPNDE